MDNEILLDKDLLKRGASLVIKDGRTWNLKEETFAEVEKVLPRIHAESGEVKLKSKTTVELEPRSIALLRVEPGDSRSGLVKEEKPFTREDLEIGEDVPQSIVDELLKLLESTGRSSLLRCVTRGGRSYRLRHRRSAGKSSSEMQAGSVIRSGESGRISAADIGLQSD